MSGDSELSKKIERFNREMAEHKKLFPDPTHKLTVVCTKGHRKRKCQTFSRYPDGDAVLWRVDPIYSQQEAKRDKERRMREKLALDEASKHRGLTDVEAFAHFLSQGGSYPYRTGAVSGIVVQEIEGYGVHRYRTSVEGVEAASQPPSPLLKLDARDPVLETWMNYPVRCDLCSKRSGSRSSDSAPRGSTLVPYLELILRARSGKSVEVELAEFWRGLHAFTSHQQN